MSSCAPSRWKKCGIATSTGFSSIDLRATTGEVISGGKPVADVRITGTADAEGNFDLAPTVFISWNETGHDGQPVVETTAHNIPVASVDELEDTWTSASRAPAARPTCSR